MADVNLSVQVNSAGVNEAIAKIDALREKGGAAASSFGKLADASTKALDAISRNGSGFKSFTDGTTSATKGAQTLRDSLNDLSRTYKELALITKNDPTARLKAAGGGDLTLGIARAREAQRLREVLNASSGSDLAAHDAKQAQIERASAARQDAMASRRAAQSQLARAQYDAANQGLGKVEQAQLRVTRATTDYARAAAAAKTASENLSSKSTAAQIDAQTRAINEQAAALGRLTQAKQGLVGAQAPEQAKADAGGEGVFASSYSYFIIAGMAQQAAQAILGVGTAAVTAASQIERSFADVDRTFEDNDLQLANLKEKLFDLSTSTPTSFVDLAQIATLGNQLGISAKDISSFTQVIAQYTAVSGESAESAATAFGRIANLTGLDSSKFENLASSIAFVARSSVATESTIQNTAKEIAALSSGAGFSAASIVGLAGALSSLAIPPERARGALSLYFGALNGAVAEGGPKLAAFASLTGKTADEVGRLVRENKGEEVFTSFIAGLSKLDTVAKTTALDTLGLSTIRVDQTMRALAQNIPLVTSALSGANKSFEANTEIASQYGTIQETFAAKTIEFQNAIFNAAGALGDALVPALAGLMIMVTDILVGFRKFADSPIGGFILTLAGAVTGLVLVLSTIVGVAALAKASMVVIPFALAGLNAQGASLGVANFVRGMLGIPAVAPAVVAGSATAAGAINGVTVASTAATIGLRVMKVALATTGLGLLAVALGTIAATGIEASNAIKLTADDITGLSDALAADTKIYEETGKAIAFFEDTTTGATDEQKKAAQQTKNWANVLGIDLVESAEKAQEAIKKIAVGETTQEAIRKALSNNSEVKAIAQDSNFKRVWNTLGLDTSNLIAEGLEGKDAKKTIAEAIKGAGIEQIVSRGKVFYADDNGNDVTKQVNDAMRLGDAFNSEKTAVQGLLDVADLFPEAATEMTAAQTELNNEIARGDATLKRYQSAVSSGIGSFLGFGTALEAIKTAATNGDGDINLSLVNAGTFGAELDAANARAVSFFTDISALAATGSHSFATQLASLGPESQGILASALDASPETQAKLEASARFAAFLASEAFASALEAEMADTNEIYANIFKTTGNLADVESFIAAQIAGTEAAWAANRPELMAAIGLVPPTPQQIKIATALADGSLTVEAKILPIFQLGQSPAEAVQTITDQLTGAQITLPASLQGEALTASLAIWRANQNASPTQLATLLNTSGLNTNLDKWVTTKGPVKVFGTLVPTNSAQSVFGGQRVTVSGSLLTRAVAKGGLVDNAPLKAFARGGKVSETPKFASGGSYGRFRGPGTGTSDSIMARVSAGEYINTAKSTAFWGPDFFDSLNRKLLPTSFMNMLGGAAASGNQGPSHVANVTVVQNNPLTRDPLKQLRQDSELVANGIWG